MTKKNAASAATAKLTHLIPSSTVDRVFDELYMVDHTLFHRKGRDPELSNALTHLRRAASTLQRAIKIDASANAASEAILDRHPEGIHYVPAEAFAKLRVASKPADPTKRFGLGFADLLLDIRPIPNGANPEADAAARMAERDRRKQITVTLGKGPHAITAVGEVREIERLLKLLGIEKPASAK